MGWLVLGFLTAFAFVDALALALALDTGAVPRGRAEISIATATFFAALIGVPILALGYANVLWRATLGATSFVVLATTFALLARRNGARALLAACGESFRQLARVPVDALAQSLRARSIVFAGLLVTAAFIGASLVLTYLIEFCRWDDEMYHTPIVGWAIQHHGFQIVDAPRPGVGGTNGYPKLGEAFSLWFAIFTDKTLVELPGTLFAAPAMLCVYAMARRYVDAVCAMGFAFVLLLVPHAWRQFCSSYVDMDVAFFLLAATFWASRPVFGFRELLMCTVAMAMAAGSKTTWLLFVPPVAVVAYVRVVAGHFASRRRDCVLAIGGSVAAVLLVGGLCIVRNWWHYGNPVWPVAYDIPKLGIHWPGIFTPQDYKGHDPAVTEGFEVPRGGMRDAMRHGYGLAVTWVAGPAGILAIALWGYGLLRAIVRRAADEAVLGIASVFGPCVVWFAVGPNFGQPRYNLHVVGVLLVACAWLLRGARMERLREGLLGAMAFLSLIPLFWMNDANFTTVEEETERLTHPLANRAYSLHPSFDWLEREKYEELLSGDEVVFSDGLIFPGLLWNFDFSNRVDYVEFTNAPDFLAKVGALDPKWLCVGGDGLARKALEQTGEWELVGRTNSATKEVAFRRKGAMNLPGATKGAA